MSYSCSTHRVIGWHVVVWRAEFCDQFVCHFIVGGYSFLLHLFTHFHGEMPQALSILFSFLATFAGDRADHTYCSIFRSNRMISLPNLSVAYVTSFCIIKQLTLEKNLISTQSHYDVLSFCTKGPLHDSPWWPWRGIGWLTLIEELRTWCMWTVYQNGIGYRRPLRCSNYLQKTKQEKGKQILKERFRNFEVFHLSWSDDHVNSETCFASSCPYWPVSDHFPMHHQRKGRKNKKITKK